jgi:hypothetical protein
MVADPHRKPDQGGALTVSIRLAVSGLVLAAILSESAMSRSPRLRGQSRSSKRYEYGSKNDPYRHSGAPSTLLISLKRVAVPLVPIISGTPRRNTPGVAKMSRLDLLFVVLLTWCVGLVGALTFTAFAP